LARKACGGINLSLRFKGGSGNEEIDYATLENPLPEFLEFLRHGPK
jgi:hypothetical protein